MTSSFEELLNSTEMLKKGDKVTGVVSRVDSEQAYVDVAGAQYDCVILKNQVSRKFVEDLTTVLTVGQEIEAIVTGVRADRERRSEDVPGVIYLSRKAIENLEYKKLVEVSWDEVVALFEKGEYINATITATTKGGLLADVKGIRAFVPASFVDTKFVSNFAAYVNNEYTFKIEELDKAADKLILNRKAVLEVEESKKLAEAFATLNEGDVLEGTVSRLAKFGAFVNVGQVDGLVHLSEISHERFGKVEDVLKVGETVKVKVLSADKETGKLALSIKALLPTKWELAKATIKAGEALEGTVRNVTDFGAFVEVQDGVEGLVHISQLSHERVEKVSDVLKQGDKVQVKVLDVDFDAKRLSLSIKDLVAKPVVEKEVKEEADFDSSYLKAEDTEFSLADKFKDLQ
ncbi:MAG: 30S ribosomal protein S1 [Gemella sp.]|nr:30S ribosomal protein S1 [Gemella sp.]